MRNFFYTAYLFVKRLMLRANKFITPPKTHVIHRFYKDSQGWFIDLPNWIGTKAQLAMVEGADIFLDNISDHTSEVYVEMSTQEMKGNQYQLKKYMDCQDGAMYSYVNSNEDIDAMWLCGVTEFVFGSMPDKIYCRKVFVK